MRIERYHPGLRDTWDRFVATSRNGTFLFQRGYLDYHQDRFEDHSLLVYAEDGEPLALLPACRRGDRLDSHAGLTYGGFLLDDRTTLAGFLGLFAAVLERCRAEGFRTLGYKTIPAIFHRRPSEEDRYALLQAGARLLRRDAWAALPLPADAPLDSRRRRGCARARRAGLQVRASEGWEAFWVLLAEVLATRHGVRPVHTLEEIRLLAARFPESIRLYGVFEEDALLAGTVLFLAGPVAHAQYIAAGERGRELGALDLLFSTLIAASERRWFSFGASTEQEGRVLNAGLMGHKEGFGARTIVHDFYELQL